MATSKTNLTAVAGGGLASIGRMAGVVYGRGLPLQNGNLELFLSTLSFRFWSEVHLELNL